MAAARNTLGDGRASTTNASSTATATTGRARSPIRSQPHSTSAAASTIATLVPLTATRCVRPVVLKSSRSRGSSLLVSPSTSPGSSPRSSEGSGPAASCRPTRSRPAARCRGDAPDSTTGGPRAESSAATSSDGAAVVTRPSTRTRWLGSRPSQPRSEVNTSTGCRRWTSRPATRSRSTRSRATTSSWNARTSPFGGTTRGSSSSTPSAVTDAARAAACASGPWVRACTRTAVANPAAAVQTHVAASTAARDLVDRSSTRPARRTRPTATAVSTDGGTAAPCQAVTQAAAAGSPSRRSGASTLGSSRKVAAIRPGPWP